MQIYVKFEVYALKFIFFECCKKMNDYIEEEE